MISTISQQLIKENIRQFYKHSDDIQYWLTRTHEWLEHDQHHVITLADNEYPYRLKQIHEPPIVLYIKGQPDLLNQLQLAMVGSRFPTSSGLQLAQDFAQELSGKGFIITSGLARGIDAASHKGALAANKPTIAILGTGLDTIYPNSNHHLAHDIAQTGALVSQFPLGTGGKPEYFPIRNQTISGLSIGTLVVEARLRSGSLITARLANEQGRDVFAIPGSPRNKQADGCNLLIKQGAKLVQSAEDIIDELPNHIKSQLILDIPGHDLNNSKPVLRKGDRALLNTIGFEPTPLDAIYEKSRLSTGKLASKLLTLQLNGYIEGTPGGYIRLK